MEENKNRRAEFDLLYNEDLPALLGKGNLMKLGFSSQQDARIAAMFLLTKKRRSEQTARNYLSTLNEFFRFLEYKAIRTISYEDMVIYSEYLAGSDPYRNPVRLAQSTQNRKISTIKSFFKYCMKVGYIQLNPAEPLETQRVDARIAQRMLNVDELEKLVLAARSRSSLASLVIYFLACTGCRRGELAGIMWRDIFIGAGGEYCVRIHGKGHKDRILKLNQSLWECVVQYRQDQGLNHHIDAADKSPLLMNKYGNNYDPQSIWKIVKQSAADAGLNKKISPHWIRHSFATEVARDKNSNIWRLQHDMGHASLNTTQQYVHIAQGMEDTSIDHLAYLQRLEDKV